MKINLANRQQLLGLLAVGVVVLWAAMQIVINPLINTWKARAKRIADLKLQVANGKTSIQRLPRIEKQWTDQSQNTLPQDLSDAVGFVLRTVDRWATSSEVTVNSKRPQWKRGDDKEYTTLECSVDATGNIRSLTEFLFEIERDPVGVKVSTVDISERDNSGSQLTLALQLSFLQLNTPATPATPTH